MEREVLGENFPEEALHFENLRKFLYKILYICFIFSLSTQFHTWRCSEGIVPERLSAGLELYEEAFCGGRFPRKISDTYLNEN